MKKLNKNYLIVVMVLALTLLCAGGMLHALAVPAGTALTVWRFW